MPCLGSQLYFRFQAKTETGPASESLILIIQTMQKVQNKGTVYTLIV